MKTSKKIMATLAVASLTGVTVMASVPLNPRYTYQYNTTTAIGDRSDWLSGLPDNTPFSDLSLPGTNDSMAYTSSLAQGVRTQSLNISEQLKHGIRVFDLGYSTATLNTTLALHTGDAPIVSSRYEPFEDAIAHLDANPRETVYFIITQENSNVSSDVFGRAFAELNTQFGSYFYKGTNPNPTLGETRGKIVLLSDIQSLINVYNAIDIRTFDGNLDESFVNGKSNLYNQWNRVKQNLHLANDSHGSGNIYVNNMAGYGAYAQPWFVASGQVNPNEGSDYMYSGLLASSGKYPEFPVFDEKIYYAGINPMAKAYIRDNQLEYTGIVLSDFPGYTLVEQIIGANYWG